MTVIPSTTNTANTVFVSNFSRYRGTPVYQDAVSSQLFFGPWHGLEFPVGLDDTWVQVRSADGLRLDLIANEVYGSSELWWVIACANEIANPFTQLFGYAAYARSPVIFSADGRACFYATAKEYGVNYNVGSSLGLTFKTTPTTLEVSVAGQARELFANLSPYPAKLDGSLNPTFWGTVNSKWLNVVWVSADTLQPAISGIIGPSPITTRSYLTNGVDEMIISLRIPSIANVITVLDASAA